MKKLSLTLGLVTLAASAHAAVQPDAGQVLQQLNTAPSLPKASNAPVIEKSATPARKRGGAKVTISRVTFAGNTLFTDAQLTAALGDVVGNTYDLAALKELADKITAFYHANDYPFARAFVPAQSMGKGTLHIQVVEGRYGAINMEGTDRHQPAAAKFLGSLSSEDVIEGKKLERASLILDDQPGYRFMPTIRPGTAEGTGDLTVKMTRDKKVGGTVSADNQGNRYTGRNRAQTDLYANSTLLFGDRTTLSGIYTEEDMWYGSAGYSAPIGASGLRGNVSYAHTYYELGKDFASLDAHGTARVAGTGVSYPLIRSQQANLSLSGAFQHKWLEDVQGVAGTSDKKQSNVVPVGLNFDNRDTLLGGGVTYGAATWTHGVLSLGNSLRSNDLATADTNGAFDKLNLDIARLQATPVTNLVLFARASGQLAGNNLDSSEDFGVGGPAAVRAYPSGEGYGDEGWFAQSEVRYTIGNVSPYLFYDYGAINTNHNSWTPGDNTRAIAGGGLGLRATYLGWAADASAAWRTTGGKPQSDTEDNLPQLWLRLAYTF